MKIRKCETEDIQAAGEFYDRVVAFLDSNINYPRWKYKQYPTGSWVYGMAEEGSQYICEEDGKIVGAFVLNTDPQGSYEKGNWTRDIPEGNYLILHALAIDPDLQGQGVGVQVLTWCENYAQENGYPAIRVDIVPDNYPAQKLYERNGYTFAGEYDLDRGYDDIPAFCLYEKNLTEYK